MTRKDDAMRDAVSRAAVGSLESRGALALVTEDARALRPYAVELRDIAFSYGKDAFVKGLSAGFERGKVTSIIGPNGCGKSTTVKIIDGFLRPQQGRVFVDGIDASTFSSKERAQRIAVLGQAGRVPAMTVESVVACGRYPHMGSRMKMGAADREIVERAMEQADVARFRDCDMRRLSGGERQRVFVAMALAQDTDIILMDEPTTYMDVKACHELMELVAGLNARDGKTIIMVIHDIDLALRYSDRVLVMRPGGTVVGEGTVDEVLQRRLIEQAFSVSISAHEDSGKKGYILHPLD